MKFNTEQMAFLDNVLKNYPCQCTECQTERWVRRKTIAVDGMMTLRRSSEFKVD